MTALKKVRHDKQFRLEHEDKFWMVDIAEWRGEDGKGELRVYAIHGDVSDPEALRAALQAEADARGLILY